MVSNGKIITRYDTEIFNLLVEWEQYAKENERIQHFHKTTTKHIKTMTSASKQVKNQLIYFSDIHDELKDDLNIFRTELLFVIEQSHESGTAILHHYNMFEQETRQREQLSENISQKLKRLVKRISKTEKETSI